MPLHPIAESLADPVGTAGDTGAAGVDALQVGSRPAYERWSVAAERTDARDARHEAWQQFLVRAVDERGDGFATGTFSWPSPMAQR
jgi:hypothetical protein